MIRFFSMKGLGLVYGAIKPSNIFFRKRNVPSCMLTDFTKAFFLDELEPCQVYEMIKK